MTVWVSVLVCVSLATQAAAQCSPSPCGVNTNCETNAGGAAICRCQPGWDHAPGSNTIEGCPNRISQSAAPSQPRVVNNRLGGIAAVAVLRQENPRPQQTDPCVPSPCGAQAQCRSTGSCTQGSCCQDWHCYWPEWKWNSCIYPCCSSPSSSPTSKVWYCYWEHKEEEGCSDLVVRRRECSHMLYIITCNCAITSKVRTP